jgi:hypothetical protein
MYNFTVQGVMSTNCVLSTTLLRILKGLTSNLKGNNTKNTRECTDIEMLCFLITQVCCILVQCLRIFHSRPLLQNTGYISAPPVHP